MTQLETRIGRQVAAHRQFAKLTQATLAEKVGCATETISRLERGTVIPPLVRLHEVAEALGVTLVDLVRQPNRNGANGAAIDRLITIVCRRTPPEIEVIADIAERIFRQW